jgi:hypothetical protein
MLRETAIHAILGEVCWSDVAAKITTVNFDGAARNVVPGC